MMVKSSDLKRKKQNKLALAVLALLITLLIFGQIFRFSKTLTNPWHENQAISSFSWDDKFTINLVIKDENISLLSFNPVEKKIVVIKLPDNFLVDVPPSSGKWQIRSVFDLGGLKVLKNTVSLFFGLAVDGVLLFEGSSENMIDQFRKSPDIFGLLSNLKSDLKLWDLLKLKFALSSVRFDKIETLDLTKIFVLEKQRLADGTEVFVGESGKIDAYSLKLADSLISDEHKSVAVFNGTNKGLIAQKGARIVTNLGANVIATANSPKVFKKSFILGSDSKTKTRLLQIFDPDLIGVDKGCSKDKNCDKISIDALGLASQRADLVLVLGEDFEK